MRSHSILGLIAVLAGVVSGAAVDLAVSAPARAAQVGAGCAVVDVATFNNRVHVHCTKAVAACSFKPGGCPQEPSPPTYVAVESTSPMAQTVVQIGVAAMTGKRTTFVFFDDNPGANPAGCNASDCRRLIGIVLQ